MNAFVREMFMRDGRGRGGYGMPRGPMGPTGRDRGYDYARYDSRNDYARDRRYEDSRDYRDYGYDYRRGDRNDYYGGYPMNDYGHEEMGRMSQRDVEKWKHMMQNEDGTRGEHFTQDQVENAARQIGINTDEFGKHTFCLAMNMMYSDYCKVAQKFGADRPEFYAEMAKAFLKDKDFDGNGEEKLWLYYKCIVEQE